MSTFPLDIELSETGEDYVICQQRTVKLARMKNHRYTVTRGPVILLTSATFLDAYFFYLDQIGFRSA
jgi:hypothetical protein